MYIGFYNYYEIYNKNRMFTDPRAPIGDDLLFPLVNLGKYLTEKGHKINTIDMDDIKNFDAIVFLEFPTFKNNYFRQLINNKFKNLYLIIFECEVVKPNNWNKENHKYFKKIFTWNDNFVDCKKYFKVNHSNKIPTDLNFDLNDKKKLCTMIAAHKFASHPLELYTERIKAIQWFERNHIEDFDLYGIGWDKHYFRGIFSRLNRLDSLRKLLKPSYPSYRGSIQTKRDVLSKYKFSIAYENARDIPGYITEKIFDCFFAGCVPIYWGASNVAEHIPVNAFIDKRNFKSYDELYKYIKNMPEKEYARYIEAIKIFVGSDKIYPFSAECFARNIVKEILGEG